MKSRREDKWNGNGVCFAIDEMEAFFERSEAALSLTFIKIKLFFHSLNSISSTIQSLLLFFNKEGREMEQPLMRLRVEEWNGVVVFPWAGPSNQFFELN